ncbi:release factor H-coupled R [Morchella conica CCBAS932]|uniref:3'-phosphate/5'-hydroxy nucleic acid ligase n=1 Tax=Morchella conica CCBAS932 TaxID=1392247 RepID=A0A3N4KPZ8_9PEZI|nr:release factor H-coupled R [Morchella conica CCBAS932]
MPATRLTLIANASQTNRCPLLLPSSDSDILTAVFTTSKAKLRIKKPTRVFLRGGHELFTSDDIQQYLKDDLVLLISAGEAYVGNTKAPPSTTCTVHTITSQLALDPVSLSQLAECAKLPGIISAVGLPDLHPGTRFPIGCTFISDGYIHPPLIGGDIGCGMSWYRTTLKADKLWDAAGVKKVAGNLVGLEGEWLGPAEREAWLSCGTADGKSLSVGADWDRYLGTIGSGNHFAELQVVEDILPYTYNDGTGQVYTPPFAPDEVILLVHSGSRGYGQHVLSQFYNSSSTEADISIPATDPKALSYLTLHDAACAWAQRSRDLIALRFLCCLESSLWDSPEANIPAYHAAIQERKAMDIHHNNVTLTPWPPAAPDTTKAIYIHRKGAAPSTPSTPFLPLPGSRGTPTLILRPLFSEATGHGAQNALSLAHGAGRVMSRSKARVGIARKYNGDTEVMTNMKPFSRSGKGRVVEGAGWVVCDDKELVWEEAPEAYKDVEVVGEEMVRCGVAAVVGRVVPRVTYKVRRE